MYDGRCAHETVVRGIRVPFSAAGERSTLAQLQYYQMRGREEDEEEGCDYCVLARARRPLLAPSSVAGFGCFSLPSGVTPHKSSGHTKWRGKEGRRGRGRRGMERRRYNEIKETQRTSRRRGRERGGGGLQFLIHLSISTGPYPILGHNAAPQVSKSPH